MSLWLGPVRWWVRLYTAGLEPSVRDRRREEVDADLWAQGDEAGGGRTTAAITMAVWVRCLSGMPDDVLWRREQPRVTASPAAGEGSSDMFGPGSRGALVLPVGAAAALLAIAVGVVVIDNIQYMEQSERLVPTTILMYASYGLLGIGLASIVAGFAVMRSRPALGVVLAVGGSWTAAVVVYWLIVPLLIALAISYVAVRRARRIAGASSGS